MTGTKNCGRKTVENFSRSQTSITDSNIEEVPELIDSDRRLIISAIASEVRISFGSTQKIFTDDLDLGKLSAR